MKLRAVGITNAGDILAIRSADAARGMRLRKIYVGNGYKEWFNQNYEILVATIAKRQMGDIIFLKDQDWS